MRPDFENDVMSRYDLAFLTACAFQLTRTWLTAQPASELEKPSNLSCFLRPVFENAEMERYELALFRALRCPAVAAEAVPTSESATMTTKASLTKFFMVLP